MHHFTRTKLKKILLLLILPLISLELLADAGYAYRYKVNVSLNDGTKLTGFFFFTSYKKGFDANEIEFKDYILSYYHFPISLYEDLKSIRVNDYLIVDFAIKGSEKAIDTNDIKSIELIEEIETPVGSRLRLLSEQEYKLMNQGFINSESIYNESYSENCSFILLNWDDSNDLEELKEKINKKIEDLTLEHNFQGVHDYIENLKPDLIKRDMLLFQYCSAL